MAAQASSGWSATLDSGPPLRSDPADVVVPVLFVVTIGLMLAVGFLGPSVAVTPLGRGGALPPYFVAADPSPWLVTGALAVAFISGTAMLLVALRALRRGWQLPVARIVAIGMLGTLAFLLSPPIGSSDFTNYSTYGHSANQGLDPYVVTPNEAARRGVPTAASVEPPWQDTTSVYGPVALGVQRLAARLGGPTLRGTAAWLSLVHCLSYLVTGLILLRMATSEATRRRVAIMWCANPIMIYALVAGSHVDAVVMMLIVAALALFRRSRLAAAAMIGLGLAVKVTAAIAGAAMAWVDRRSPRRLAELALGAGVVAGGLYLTASPHVLDQTRRAGRFVSPATPWWFFIHRLNPLMSHGAAHAITTAGVVVLGVALGWAILRLVPRVGDQTIAAVRATFAYSAAWLMAAPYLLPWYDSLGWATLPLVDENPVDELFVLHTTVLAFAFLPGRDLPRSGAFEVLITALHSYLSPLALLALNVVLLRRAWAVHRRSSPSPALSGAAAPPLDR